jgi:hypothetical protein
MNAKFIALFREKIRQRLQAKTGWGRNDLMLEIEAALADASAELLDEE